jgi:hypothetical protein
LKDDMSNVNKGKPPRGRVSGNTVQRRSDLFKRAPEKEDQVETCATAERTGAAASGATLVSFHLALEGGEGSLHKKKSSQYAFATL